VAIHVAIFTAVYAIVANLFYIIDALKGKLKSAGASVAHIGFGMVLVGILISSAKKTVLSWNTTGVTVLQKNEKGHKAILQKILPCLNRWLRIWEIYGDLCKRHHRSG